MIFKQDYSKDYIEDKLLIINAPESFVYSFAKLYIEQSENTVQKKRPMIAFSFSIDKDVNTELLKYLKFNNIFIYNHDLHKLKEFKKFMGYRKIIYFGLFNELTPLPKDSSFIYKIEQLFESFMGICSNAYFVLPDVIYEPSEGIYDLNSMANSSSTNRIIAYYVFIDYLISFYKKSFKYPINKIIVPYCFSKSYKSDNKLSFKYFEKNIELPSRQLLLMEDFAYEVFNLFKTEMLLPDSNYMLSSDFYIDEKLFNNYIKKKTLKYSNIENKRIIIKGNIHIDSSHYEKILKNLRNKKNV